MESTPVLGVSDAIAVINQSLEYAFPVVQVVGEVASFKINHDKWVFFNLKDDEGSIGCFMSIFNLRVQIEDGMKIMIVATPKLTQWGKFSLTVQQIMPAGEGSIKKSFDLLRAKLNKEGLFVPERKRTLPRLPERIGVISSVEAAGYKDFIKIVQARFGNLDIKVYHTLVQGVDAPEQIIQGLEYFNGLAEPPEVICILRGGGSTDDLAAFNDEPLVRKIASSRVPILTGIGHEVDTTIADLAADVRASTPSNAAEILVPDGHALTSEIVEKHKLFKAMFISQLDKKTAVTDQQLESIRFKTEQIFYTTQAVFNSLSSALRSLNPELVLKRGYAIMRGVNGELLRSPTIGQMVNIENFDRIIEAKVENVRKK
ncbi:exodeoxyribonuclease VII large subunit [Candidatus Saccharibacteria bacterium]|nr:exodeoxyribonuclease VII large subunit [Candidatus Saccharibacteria bacterium]